MKLRRPQDLSNHCTVVLSLNFLVLGSFFPMKNFPVHVPQKGGGSEGEGEYESRQGGGGVRSRPREDLFG